MSEWDTRYPPTFVEGVDYTVEGGKLVMTEKFHRDRGYCCGSGCRKCPYRTKMEIMKEVTKHR